MDTASVIVATTTTIDDHSNIARMCTSERMTDPQEEGDKIMKHEEIRNIAGLAYTAWNGLYITEIDSDSVTIRYGYQASEGMVYKRRVTRPIDYDYTPDWGDEETPSFTYHGDRYFIDEFMII